MSKPMRKFSMLGRQKLESSLEDIFGNISTVQYCLSKLRSKVRTFLLRIAAGESVHPEIVRMQMGIFVKSAVLRAEVFTMPTKSEGLRMQSSEVHIGAPGVGKGLGCAWGNKIMRSSRQMASDYLRTQSKLILNVDQGHGPEAGNNLVPNLVRPPAIEVKQNNDAENREDREVVDQDHGPEAGNNLMENIVRAPAIEVKQNDDAENREDREVVLDRRGK